MDDDRGMPLVHLLRQVTVEFDLLGAEFARLHHLHPSDLRALIHLLDAARAGLPATPGWLALQLGLDASSVTALVHRLEELGHVRRRRDTADRRRVLLDVDDRAVTLGWSFFGPLIGSLVSAMRAFEDAELATVERFLRAMVEATATHRRAGGRTTRGSSSGVDSSDRRNLR